MAVTKCVFLATCYLLSLGATRRYLALRGFAPFVIDPKLVMPLHYFVEMYPLITFSYKGHLLGEPILDTNMSCKALFLYIMSMFDQNISNLSLLYWKYSKLLCIRTLIKVSYHTSSVEAVHSQVIFSFMIIFNCSFLSYLTFILLFSFVIVLVLQSSCRR